MPPSPYCMDAVVVIAGCISVMAAPVRRAVSTRIGTSVGSGVMPAAINSSLTETQGCSQHEEGDKE